MTPPTWSDRLGDLLDDATPGGALRTSRGRAYERSGRVTDLRSGTGVLSARVQGSRATPYQVAIGLPTLPPQAWDVVVRVIASQVGHGARLLAGQVPQGLEDELAERGVRVFPHPAELDPTCTCDDPVAACKHVAATVEAAARALDADPFLLFRLRGRGREALLADLARARRGASDETGRPLAELPAADWTALRGPLGGISSDGAADPREPSADEALTARGDPAGWAGGVAAADVFGPLVDRGRRWATTLVDDLEPGV